MPGFRIQGIGDASGGDVPAQPMYSYTWKLGSVAGITGLSGALINARTATKPSWTHEIVEGMGSSLKYKYAKNISWIDVKISWYDTFGLSDILKQWRNSIWTPSGGIKAAGAYKTDSWLKHYTYDMAAYQPWHLVNSWPREIKTGDLTYTDSNFNIAEVTLAYDWAVEEDGAGGI